jgi:tRNA modification GTPase
MDTIVAVATPPGRSAIAVVRLSGPRSVAMLRTLVGDSSFHPEPNRVVLRAIKISDDDVLDQALITFFAAPNSFSGEDMVEISCHGSPIVVRRLLDHLQRLDARLAGPGEFTLRALRNGKINLSQAEAIRDLINARSAAAAQQATRQLQGELATRLQPCKQRLIEVIVRLESALEFVEDDLPEMRRQENVDDLTLVRLDMQVLATTYQQGHLIRDGIKVTLVGRPNVGKSSLFNGLLKIDRAIVTELPGTTRDSITESISLKGVPVALTDTAGMREAVDRIEAIGVERTHRAIADADLLVVVIDGSGELQQEDRDLLDRASTLRHVVAINKADLPQATEVERAAANGSSMVHISALTGEGLEDLTAAILEPFGTVDSDEASFLITDSRHYDLLVRAESSTAEAIALLEAGASEELVLVGLHNALSYLGEITGETTTEEILGQIFSTFCIGK